MSLKGKANQRPAPKQPAAAKKTSAAPRPERPAVPLTQTFQPGFWQDNWMQVLLLLVIPFGLYFTTIGFGYVLDDQMVIWENAYVQKGFAGIKDIFSYDSFKGYFKEQKFLLEGGRYRPLSLATFAMEVGFFGPSHPGIGHFINILLYGLNCVLLYRVLLGLFPIREGGSRWFNLPLIGALIFLLHPLHVEVVANIKGRDEILALMGSLGALYATLKYFDTEKGVWLFWSFVSLLLGLLAKENSLTYLAVIPLTLYFFTKIPRHRIFSSSIPLLLASLVFIFIRFRAMGYMLNHGQSMNDVMNNPFLGMTTGEHWATIFLTLGWYVKLLFVPHPLTHDYYPYHVPKVNWSDLKALGSLVLYLAMGAYAVWQLSKTRKNEAADLNSGHRIGAWSILYYLLTLSIVSNVFVGVGTFMNERFVYMPSVAVCVLAGWFLARKLPSWMKEGEDRPYILGVGLLAVISAAMAYRVVTRVPDWKDALALNTSAVRISVNSCRSHCFYATAIYTELYKNSKDEAFKATLVDSMELHIDRAIQINPNYPSALQMKAAIAATRFEQDKQMDKLFHTWEIVMEKIPTNTSMRKFVGEYMKYMQGRTNPQKYAAFCHRIGYEFFFQKRKDNKSALEFLTYAVDLQTEDTRCLQDIAEVYEAAGDKTKAAEMRRRAEASKNL